MKIRNKSVNTLNSKQIYIIYLYNLLLVYFIGRQLASKKNRPRQRRVGSKHMK
jgi:hypothetical protein